MSLTIPAGVPPWFNGFVRQIEREFVNTVPTNPVALQQYVSTDLPDATKYRGSMIWVDDLKVPAISDGTDWLPVTLGASL